MADARVRAAVQRCAEPEQMDLCNPRHGASKHLRWFRLSVEEGGQVLLSWGQHRDHAQQFLWSRLRYVPPKRRVVTGVEEEVKDIAICRGRGYQRSRMFRVHVAERDGDPDGVLVAATCAGQKAKWLSALRCALDEARAARTAPPPEPEPEPQSSQPRQEAAEPAWRADELGPPAAGAEDTCVVCWAAERTAQLCHDNGTSHQCVCERCADHLSSREQPCPMCRQPVALVVKRVFR